MVSQSQTRNSPIQSIGIYFGSTNGDTARVATLAADLCTAHFASSVPELLDVAEFYLDDMPDFDLVLLGMPTWNIGQMQRDWEVIFPEYDNLDLTGIPVGLFGLGDQVAYPDTFADALAFLADKVQERGARLVGRWDPAADPEGYSFSGSWALVEGRFVGLVLDEINQPGATPERLRRWLAQIAAELAQLASIA